VVVLAAVAAAVGSIHELRDSGSSATRSLVRSTTDPPATGQASTRGSHRAPSGAARIRIREIAELPAPVQDAAVAVLGDRAYAFGGLDSGGGSTTEVSVVYGSSVRSAGRLPLAIHDAAAAPGGRGRLVVLGGGQVASYAGIAAFDPASGGVRIVGRLPTPLSDLSVATVGGTTYAVGGFTGAAWSDGIVAIDAGRARRVARLPIGLRYAAVAAVGNAVLIAGGRTEAGPSRAIYRFTPGDGSVARIGTLPQPLMHASAGAIRGIMYVVGGIGGAGAPVSSVLAVGAGGDVKRAATLPYPLSDAGVASLPGRLLVIGGSDGSGPTRAVLSISPTAQPVHRRHRARRREGLPRRFRGPLPGDLLIADRGNNRMLMIDPAGHILWRYPSRPGQPRLYFDDDAFFTPGGHSIISNEEDNHDIVEISYPSGRIVWRYGHSGQPGSSHGYLNTPDDAYKLRGGLVIVSDDRNCRLLEIRGHHVVRSIGSPASCTHDPPRSFASPNGDTPLANGHVLVSEINGSWVDELTLGGRLVRTIHAPVGYPSDPQVTRHGNILLADYSHPGAVVILDRRTGHLLWRYRPTSGPGELDHPSLASMLPNGNVIVVDDYNDRIVIIDPGSKRIVWQYGHTAVGGTGRGYLHVPDGFDFVPVTPGGRPNPAAIRHGP
jgi:putative pyrroloquinoline-quinone binding quinoprotein